MKIVDEEKTTFGELKSGDVFSIGEVYYMRVDGISDKDGDDYNTVSLSKGWLDFWRDGTEVQKLNATLVIGGEEDEIKEMPNLRRRSEN